MSGSVSALAHADGVESQSREEAVTAALGKEARLQAEPEDAGGFVFSQLIERLRKRHVRRTLSHYGIQRARLHGWIDSYTFSKAMAEMLLVKHRGNVPLVIPGGRTMTSGTFPLCFTRSISAMALLKV